MFVLIVIVAGSWITQEFPLLGVKFMESQAAGTRIGR
jgi:hypothetical protein